MKEPKLKTVYVCSNCGETSPRWMGRCPSCGSWNTMNEDVVAEAPKAGLSFGQRHTLYHINAHQGLSIQELAELLQVDHSTMSRNVKKLMQADLVETFQDDADKRRKMIALSAVGRQVLDEATESINLTISNALQSLDEDEIENVITNLRKYSKALEGVR